MSDQFDPSEASPSRREFIKTAASATAVTAASAALLATGNYAYAQGSDKIKVGLIGCGGRGTGAAADALQADPGAALTAMGDIYRNQLENSLRTLQGQEDIKNKVQ